MTSEDQDFTNKLERDIAKLEQWVNDLQSGMFINCVYCGHRYGPANITGATMVEAKTPSMRTALEEHILTCQKHPLSVVAAERDRYKETLKDIGQSVPCESNECGGCESDASPLCDEYLKFCRYLGTDYERVAEENTQLWAIFKTCFGCNRCERGKVNSCWCHQCIDLSGDCNYREECDLIPHSLNLKGQAIEVQRAWEGGEYFKSVALRLANAVVAATGGPQ